MVAYHNSISVKTVDFYETLTFENLVLNIFVSTLMLVIPPHHAALKSKLVSSTHTCPRFTPELRILKAAGSRLEQLQKKTGLSVPFAAYKDHIELAIQICFTY